MKSMFITLAFAFFLSTTLNAQQPPIEYTQADLKDTNVHNPIIPGSVWNGLDGMGTKWCFPQYPQQNSWYNGICIWRLTDATVFPGGDVVQVPDNDSATGNFPAQTDGNTDNIISIPNGYSIHSRAIGQRRIRDNCL